MAVVQRGRTLARRRFKHPAETIIEALLLLAALSAVWVTVSIVVVLVSESSGFFSRVSLSAFFADSQWTPLFESPHYGILPLLSGTLTISVIAMLVAVPLGSMTAIYLSEFATPRVRERVKPVIELLGGMPTVVFGYFALLFVTPFLQRFIPDLPGFNLLGPGLVVGILIVPIISSLAEDALRAVSMDLREASFALGASRLQTAIKIVLPAAASGVIAAILLAFSRAMGETMVVAIAAGQQPNLTFDPTQSAATLTSFIAQVSMGDVPHGSIGYQSLYAAGLTLFVLCLLFNMLGYWVRRRVRDAR